MKYCMLLIMTTALSGIYCSKSDNKKENCKADLVFAVIQTPTYVNRGSDIIAYATCTGQNLCYSFSHMQIKFMGNNTYDVKAIATIPCGPAFCQDAIYHVDTTVRIASPLVAGQYILRYQNPHGLFRSDTVIVN